MCRFQIVIDFHPYGLELFFANLPDWTSNKSANVTIEMKR